MIGQTRASKAKLLGNVWKHKDRFDSDQAAETKY